MYIYIDMVYAIVFCYLVRGSIIGMSSKPNVGAVLVAVRHIMQRFRTIIAGIVFCIEIGQ